MRSSSQDEERVGLASRASGPVSERTNAEFNKEFREDCARLNVKYQDHAASLDQIQDKYAHAERRFMYWKQFWQNIQALRERYYDKEFSKGGGGIESLRNLTDTQRDLLTKSEEELFQAFNPGKTSFSFFSETKSNAFLATKGKESAVSMVDRMPGLSGVHMSQASHAAINSKLHNKPPSANSMDAQKPLPAKTADHAPESSGQPFVPVPPAQRVPTPVDPRSSRPQTKPHRPPPQNIPPFKGTTETKSSEKSSHPHNATPNLQGNSGEQKTWAEMSNVERFWAEEQARKGKKRERQAHHVKKKPQFVTPANPTEAAALWAKMKEDLETKVADVKGSNGTDDAKVPTRNESKSGYSFAKPEGSAQSQSDLSVKELRRRLAAMGVKADDCIDKDDLLKRFTEAQNKRKEMLANREREAQRRVEAAAERERKAKEEVETKDRVIKEVHAWARGKGIVAMLNYINKAEAGTKGALKKDCRDANVVKKEYYKCLLKIHPDKHLNKGFEEFTRATEMFKLVNEAYNSFQEESAKLEKLLSGASRARRNSMY
jgi:hypothetical protein